MWSFADALGVDPRAVSQNLGPSVFIVEGPAATPKVAWRWTADIYKDRIATSDVLAALPRN